MVFGAQYALLPGKLFRKGNDDFGFSTVLLMRIVRPASLVFYASLAIILGGVVTIVGALTMPYGGWFGLVPVLILAWRGLRQPLRRRRLARQGIPEAWRVWLHDHVPFYAALGEEARIRFEQDVQFFIDEQTFEALDDLAVTDSLRLGVAAGAALLLHGRPDWELSTNRTILFYPDRFDDEYYDGDYAAFDGMVHAQGPIILTASSVEADWARPGNGHNVVLHELAHLFDFDQGGPEGTPSLLDPASAEAWRALVQREMRRVRLGTSLLRGYAATNPSEFFAVAVENFFDRPDVLHRRHPHLFEALVAFFNLDPRVGKGV